MWGSAISALLGAVVGSLTAGVIAWWLQRQNLREARKMREDEKLERDKALGMSVLLKMGHIHMVFKRMKFHFEKGINFAEAAGHTDFSKHVKPLATMPVREQFTHEELGLVFSLKNSALFNAVWNMNPRQVTLLDAVSAFNAKRIELSETLQSFPVEFVEGTSAKFTIPDESRLRFEIEKNVVSDLIKAIYPLAKEGAEDAEKTLTALQEALNLNLELGVKFSLINSEVSEETPQQNSG